MRGKEKTVGQKNESEGKRREHEAIYKKLDLPRLVKRRVISCNRRHSSSLSFSSFAQN